MFDDCCVLCVVFLVVVGCVSHVACRFGGSLFFVCCLLLGVCCLLVVVSWSLFGGCCLLVVLVLLVGCYFVDVCLLFTV